MTKSENTTLSLQDDDVVVMPSISFILTEEGIHMNVDEGKNHGLGIEHVARFLVHGMGGKLNITDVIDGDTDFDQLSKELQDAMVFESELFREASEVEHYEKALETLNEIKKAYFTGMKPSDVWTPRYGGGQNGQA